MLGAQGGGQKARGGECREGRWEPRGGERRRGVAVMSCTLITVSSTTERRGGRGREAWSTKRGEESATGRGV